MKIGEFKAAGPELNGEQIATDMPSKEHLRNKGGSDGAGLCVFTSIDHCARWANEPSLIGFRDFMTAYPGGGYPEKVDKYIPAMAQSKGLSAPPYIQHTGGDVKFLELALKTGRMVAVTYAGNDGVFYNGPIAHMVNLVYLSDKSAVILDNNNPDKYLWMSREDFLKRWRAMGGGWAFVLLKAGPPPIPINWEGEHAPDWKRVAPPGRPIVGDEKRPSKIRIDERDDQGRLLSSEEGLFPTPVLKPKGPFDPDPLAPPPPPKMVDHGVMTSFVDQKETWRYNGQKVDRDTATMILVGQLVDDSTLYRLTINFDDEALRKRILADLNTAPELAAWRAKVVVQDYPTTHWAVSGVGHQPGIILQAPPRPDGKAAVLFRQTTYDGPLKLAEALRNADGKYNPRTDPDPAKPVAPNLTNVDLGKLLGSLPGWAWAALAAAAYLFLQRKQEKPKA